MMSRVSVVLAALSVLLLSAAVAQAQPSTLGYSGFLADADGVPYEGEVDISVSFHGDPSADDRVWGPEVHWGVEVVDGWFSLELGSRDAFDFSFAEVGSLWLEIEVEGETLLPRPALDAAPYAFAASEATGALAAELDDLRARLDALEATPVAWSDITDRPAGLDDGDDVGLTTVSWSEVADRPAGLDDGDDVLTEADVDAYVDDNGYYSEILWTDILAIPEGFADGVDDDTQLTEAEVDGYADDNGYLTELPSDLVAFDDALSVEGSGDDLVLTGINLHIRNGQGGTFGNPDASYRLPDGFGIYPPHGTPNGLGNLIIGYNEAVDITEAAGDRTGSHNLVVGPMHSYSSYGGVVAGVHNTVSGEFATVSGGLRCAASGPHASVSGGRGNTASDEGASVAGGEDNLASGPFASVSGGHDNVASGQSACVAGGFSNVASGGSSVVSGGGENAASAGSVFGGLWNTASASYASVVGGRENTASGGYATVSGGRENTASGDYSSVSGGFLNTASGDYSSVSGGYNNAAEHHASVVFGGRDNSTVASYDIAP